MKSSIQILNELEREVVMTLTYDELKPHFDKAYHTAQAEAQLDGFRKGKVPLTVIKTRFGKAIERDALGDIAEQCFRESIEEHKLDVAGTPILKSSQRTDDKGAEFTIAFEVYPEFELVDLSSIHIEKPLREISEEDVQLELRNIRLRTSALEPAESVADTMHVVKLKFSEIDEQTNTPLLGGKEREYFLDNENIDPILRNDVLNLKTGDVFRYTETHAAGEHGDHEHSHEYQVSVVEIRRVVLPELTEEYVKRISSDQFSTEEELVNDIKQSLQRFWDKELKEILRNQIVDKMVDAHTFHAPKSLVATTTLEMIDEVKKKYPDDQALKRAKPEELYEQFAPNAEISVRWQLIAGQIIEKEELTVDEEGLQKMADSIGMEKEMVRVAVEKNVEIRNRMVTDRLFDYLLERITITEVPYDAMAEQVEE